MTNTHVFILSLVVGAFYILIRRPILKNICAKYQMACGQELGLRTRKIISLVIILAGLAIMLAGCKPQ